MNTAPKRRSTPIHVGLLVVAGAAYSAVMFGPQLAGASNVKPVDFRNLLPAPDAAAESAAAKRILTLLRTQISRYQEDHQGESPRLLDRGWDELIEARSPDANNPRYLSAAPVNPRVMSSALGRWEDADLVAQGDRSARPGWYYNQATGEICAAEFDESTGTWRSN